MTLGTGLANLDFFVSKLTVVTKAVGGRGIAGSPLVASQEFPIAKERC